MQKTEFVSSNGFKVEDLTEFENFDPNIGGLNANKIKPKKQVQM